MSLIKPILEYIIFHDNRKTFTVKISYFHKDHIKIIHYKTLNFESLTPINVEKAFIIHFRFKSTEELINKNKRGFYNWLDNKTLQWTLRGHIDDYFNQNEITLEKINYIEKELNIKLYFYRIKYYLKKLIF